MNTLTRVINSDLNDVTYLMIDYTKKDYFVIATKTRLECNNESWSFCHGKDAAIFKCIQMLSEEDLKGIYKKFFKSSHFVKFEDETQKVYLDKKTNTISFKLEDHYGVVNQYDSYKLNTEKIDWVAVCKYINRPITYLLEYRELNEISIKKMKTALEIIERLHNDKNGHYSDEWIYNHSIAPSIHNALLPLITEQWKSEYVKK